MEGNGSESSIKLFTKQNAPLPYLVKVTDFVFCRDHQHRLSLTLLQTELCLNMQTVLLQRQSCAYHMRDVTILMRYSTKTG